MSKIDGGLVRFHHRHAFTTVFKGTVGETNEVNDGQSDSLLS
jgi:hypothetical protein